MKRPASAPSVTIRAKRTPAFTSSATAQHTRLGSLVPEATRETRKVDTCAACHGYLKTLTTLVPAAADELGLLDLATVELDIAALEHGYARPGGVGVSLRVRLQPRAGGLLGAWRS